jgi:hypothetical protein
VVQVDAVLIGGEFNQPAKFLYCFPFDHGPADMGSDIDLHASSINQEDLGGVASIQ